MILNDDKFVIYEKKTNKRRVVKINKGFQHHIQLCHDALNITNDNEKCFISRKRMVYSTQRINILLKEIKKKYNLKIEHFSTHSLRKTWALQIYRASGNDASLALQKLSILMNHASVSVTRTYLGITESQMLDTYDLLDFWNCRLFSRYNHIILYQHSLEMLKWHGKLMFFLFQLALLEIISYICSRLVTYIRNCL